MKKYILIPLFLMLWVSAAAAEQAAGAGTTGAKPTGSYGTAFEGRFAPGYWGVWQEGNNIAGEYDYLKSSAAGAFDLEWDPLPHRFVFESYILNKKDFFGEMDYSYLDVVVFNAYTRGVYHNLNHYSFGPDDLTTLSPSFTDKNPDDLYAIENALTRAFIRFKTPDFPLHLFAEIREVERNGTIQQRFLRGFTGGLDKVSQTRTIDWNTEDVKVGVNSHLGPVEAEYSHTEKTFAATGEKKLFDTYTSPAASIPHNFVPDLKSSTDTIKLHTSYSGRLALAGTYTNGDKKNEDSGAGVKFTNAAGDLTYMPWTSVIMSLKYRHYEIDSNNPDTVNNVTPTGTTVVNVRDSISSTRDAVNGTIRYRATDRLTLRAEYGTETTDRTTGGNWDLPESTTKNTTRLGLVYYVMKKVTFRADGSMIKVDNPAYATDPDSAGTARASISWMPTARTSTMFSYSMALESRDQLGAPLGGGSRKTQRDQGLASFTVMVGDRSSVTASYSYFKNKVDQTLTLPDGTGAFQFEPGVPYADVAHVGSLALTVAPVEGVNVTASAARSYSRGAFDLNGSVPNTGSDITQLSDMKVIDTVIAAGIEMEFNKNVGTEIQGQYRKYDDELDNAQDGTVKTIMATLSLKW